MTKKPTGPGLKAFFNETFVKPKGVPLDQRTRIAEPTPFHPVKPIYQSPKVMKERIIFQIPMPKPIIKRLTKREEEWTLNPTGPDLEQKVIVYLMDNRYKPWPFSAWRVAQALHLDEGYVMDILNSWALRKLNGVRKIAVDMYEAFMYYSEYF